MQAQIINLLEELQKSLHLTMLFISHDLSVVRCMTDRAVVMYLGKIMEMGPTEHLFGAPAHPYTRNLIDAVPEPDPDCPPKESTMIGEPPSPMDIPGGCRFHPRCPYAKTCAAALSPNSRTWAADILRPAISPMRALGRRRRKLNNKTAPRRAAARTMNMGKEHLL